MTQDPVITGSKSVASAPKLQFPFLDIDLSTQFEIKQKLLFVSAKRERQNFWSNLRRKQGAGSVCSKDQNVLILPTFLAPIHTGS